MNERAERSAAGVLAGGLLLVAAGSAAAAGAVDGLLAEYRSAGAGEFDAGRGKTLWQREATDARTGQARACTTCHSRNLTLAGKHARTGKKIDPMAPSVNPNRLTERKKIEKWFRRNCKWTLGRECTAQEKGDVLTYLSGQ